MEKPQRGRQTTKKKKSACGAGGIKRERSRRPIVLSGETRIVVVAQSAMKTKRMPHPLTLLPSSSSSSSSYSYILSRSCLSCCSALSRLTLQEDWDDGLGRRCDNECRPQVRQRELSILASREESLVHKIYICICCTGQVYAWVLIAMSYWFCKTMDFDSKLPTRTNTHNISEVHKGKGCICYTYNIPHNVLYALS